MSIANFFPWGVVFFFSRKEAKALVLLRRRLSAAQTSAKPTQK
jgi:hypothetical protein